MMKRVFKPKLSPSLRSSVGYVTVLGLHMAGSQGIRSASLTEIYKNPALEWKMFINPKKRDNLPFV